MEIRTYVNTVIKRWWLIGLFLVLAAISSQYYSSLQIPIYSATVTMAINPNAPVQLFPYLGSGSGDVFGLRDPLASLATGYQEYLHSRTFTNQAAKKLNLPMDGMTLAGMLSTSLVPNTNFLHLTVVWTDPFQAQQIANGLVNLLLQQLEEKVNSGPRGEIQSLINYYKPKVEALRRERDQIENDPGLSPVLKAQQLIAVDTRLTPMEELYLKLRTSAGDPISPAEIFSSGGLAATAIQPASDAITVMDWAYLPTDPEGSGARKNLLMAVFSGLILAIGISFVLEYMDETVRTPRQMEQALGVAPLAVIQKIARRGRRRGKWVPFFRRGPGAKYMSHALGPKLITAIDPLDPISESFRLARTVILGHAPVGACQVLLITSAEPGDGKSTTLANLAVAAAQGGKKVVVVDADLRRPTLHSILGVSNEAGLSAVLAGEGEVGRWLQSTCIDGLRILTAGSSKKNPADLLSSPGLKEVLDELRGCAQVVLIDGPALAIAADALELARKADGVLLVADASKTASSALLEARDAIRQLGANFLGVVLTKYLGKTDKSYYKYAARTRVSAPRLGEYLIKSNFLTADQLREALRQQGEMASKGTRKRIGEVLVEEGYITSEALAEASRQQDVPRRRKNGS